MKENSVSKTLFAQLAAEDSFKLDNWGKVRNFVKGSLTLASMLRSLRSELAHGQRIYTEGIREHPLTKTLKKTNLP